MDFPQDQMILFKAVDASGAAIARYSVVNLGKGTVDDVTLGDCHKAEQDHFVYFYDTTNKKSVLLDFVEEAGKEARGVFYPNLVEVKGPNPIEFENGYVAFEDLPADKQKDPDDEDWDDEDDEDLDDDEDGLGDDEDGEEVYDENE